MPIIGSAEYNATSGALEKLADGIKKHAAEAKFPASLVEEEVRDVRTDLEDTRETYEKAQAEADQAYKTYSKLLTKDNALVAAAQRMLQGFYGLRSELLKDFGFTPPKPGGRKGPRGPRPSK